MIATAHIDVAVIGGGVIGASAAYHLAARGWRDVLLLDRGAGPGEGSTGRATGVSARSTPPRSMSASPSCRGKS